MEKYSNFGGFFCLSICLLSFVIVFFSFIEYILIIVPLSLVSLPTESTTFVFH